MIGSARITMTVASDGSCTISPKNMARSGESGIGMTVNVDSTIQAVATGKYAYIDFLTPDGVALTKGDYDASSGTFTVVLGENDIALLKDGEMKLQFVLSDVLLPTTPVVVLDGDAIESDVLLGKTFYSDDATDKKTGSLVLGSDTSDATASESDIVSPETAYVNGIKITGTLIKNPTVDLVVAEPNTVGYANEIAWAILHDLTYPSGLLSNLPADSKHLFDNADQYTGDIAELPRSLTHIEIETNTGIFGDCADLPTGLVKLALYDCAGISGIYSPNATIDSIDLNSTSMSDSDTDNTLIALAAITTVVGSIALNYNRTSASDDAVSVLTGLGWYLDIGP